MAHHPVHITISRPILINSSSNPTSTILHNLPSTNRSNLINSINLETPQMPKFFSSNCFAALKRSPRNYVSKSQLDTNLELGKRSTISYRTTKMEQTKKQKSWIKLWTDVNSSTEFQPLTRSKLINSNSCHQALNMVSSITPNQLKTNLTFSSLNNSQTDLYRIRSRGVSNPVIKHRGSLFLNS